MQAPGAVDGCEGFCVPLLTALSDVAAGFTAAQLECGLGLFSNQMLKEAIEVLTFVSFLAAMVVAYLRYDNPHISTRLAEASCRFLSFLKGLEAHRRIPDESLSDIELPSLERDSNSIESEPFSFEEKAPSIALAPSPPSTTLNSGGDMRYVDETATTTKLGIMRSTVSIVSSIVSTIAIVLYYWLWCSLVWYGISIWLEGRMCIARPDDLQHLRFHDSVTISGSSAGGDMSVQFHIAYSSLVSGACGFTAQPYRCAITRFTNETLVRSNSSCKKYDCAKPYDAGNAVQLCLGAPGGAPPCPSNFSIRYDHCKFYPNTVNVTELERIVKAVDGCNVKGSVYSFNETQQARRSCIDAPENLSRSRVYLFRGLEDHGHRDGVCRNTRDLYLKWISDAEQVKLRNNMHIGHATPMPWMCRGNSWNGESLDVMWGHQGHPCAGPPTDGAEECLKHLFPSKLIQPFVWNAWYQTKLPMDWLSQYHLHARVEGKAGGGFERDVKFYLFVPRDCRKGIARCSLHVHLYGCRDAPGNPIADPEYGYAREDARLLTSNFHVWAATNNIAVLYPFAPANPREGTIQESWGEVGDKQCWDAYGESGENYATQAGLQMRQIRHAIALVTGR
eukprot:CAMPEP_0114503856 /NCGR_PEP_ID=MMETSP0109-20121206/9877_1 /TAXON_ID=29199 /ORGANISM="Chlorarachnion reptans, Strain CCCM449" /LENGTH=618 /DNA_ID=CAMNT_0001681925 /DNA_START=337 /DNA_END=2194 /DNA_ORIENTATION=+